MLVPCGTGRTIRLRVSRPFLFTLFLLILLLFNLDIFLVDRFFDSVNPLTRDEHLLAEIDNLRIVKDEYYSEIVRLGVKMEELITRMEDYEIEPNIGALPPVESMREGFLSENLEEAYRTWELKADFWIERLDEKIKERELLLASTPSIWPTEGYISCGFRWRKDPFTGKRMFHQGVDISAGRGTPVVAPGDGKVVFVGWSAGYGKLVEIDHGYGILTRFGHLHNYNVKEGQLIRRGERLGKVGSTGRSTGPHLHYEIRYKGKPINPIPYLKEDEERVLSQTPASEG